MFSNPTSIPREGLIAEYLLDGNANDTAGGNNGSASNISWVESEVWYVKENAIFNGSSSKVVSTQSSLSNFSISVFFKWDVAPSSTARQVVNCIWSVDSMWITWGHPASDFEKTFYIHTSNWYFPCKIQQNLIAWVYYHIVWVYDWSTAKIYVNWELDHSVSVTWTIQTSNTLNIGHINNGSYFDWSIWLVRLYNKILSESDIKSLFFEWSRKLWPSILQEYPELFKWCVWYWDFKWDASNIITGEKATVNGATLTTDHLWNSNSAYNFDGINDYINQNISALWTKDFTWVMLFKTTSTDAEVIASTSQTTWYPSFIVASWLLQFRITTWSTVNAISTTSINDWDWHLAVWTREWGTHKIYIDGVLENTATNSWALNGTQIYFWNFSSLVSSVFFTWDIWLFLNIEKALSSSEISLLNEIINKKYIYSLAKYTPQSLPKPLLKFDGSYSGSTVYDQSGNWHNGTMNWTLTPIRKNKSSWFDFNGSNNYIDVSDSAFDADGSFAVFATVKFDSFSSTAKTRFLSKRDSGADGWMILVNTNGKLRVDFYANGWTYHTNSAPNVTLSTWVYYRFTYNDITKKLQCYINGKPDWSVTTSWSHNQNGVNFRVWRVLSSYLDWIVFDPVYYDTEISEKQAEQDFYSNYI